MRELRYLTIQKAAGTLRVTAAGRLRKGARPSIAALSDEVFGRTWGDRDDAVYDRWREIYSLRQG